jgi:hypothetical protein
MRGTIAQSLNDAGAPSGRLGRLQALPRALQTSLHNGAILLYSGGEIGRRAPRRASWAGRVLLLSDFIEVEGCQLQRAGDEEDALFGRSVFVDQFSSLHRSLEERLWSHLQSGALCCGADWMMA